MENITVYDKQIFKKILKERLNNIPIPELAKILAFTCFRNSIIEDYHVSYGISDNDMKALNKDVVNRIATVLHWWNEGKFASLNTELGFAAICTKEWDDPEDSELAEAEEMFDEMLFAYKKANPTAFEHKTAEIPNQIKCFCITEKDLYDIIDEMTNNNSDTYYIDNDNGVPIICVEDILNFEPFDLECIIGDYYGITVKNVHWAFYPETEETKLWVEYI